MCWFVLLPSTSRQQSIQLRVVVGEWNAWGDLLMFVNGDEKTECATACQGGAGRSGPGSPQTPEHKIQFAIAAVYRGVVWRQGFLATKSTKYFLCFRRVLWLRFVITNNYRTNKNI